MEVLQSMDDMLAPIIEELAERLVARQEGLEEHRRVEIFEEVICDALGDIEGVLRAALTEFNPEEVS
jgi:hypothetical protein